MKKLKTTLILFGVVLLLFSEDCFAATVETSSAVTNITKYIAIGIAVLVVILLLMLGYKMDSKENELDNYKAKRNKKKEKDDIVKEDPKYEADKVVYEPDDVNINDILEPIEYDENEESLFSNSNMDKDSIIEKTPEDSLETDSNADDINLNELENMLNEDDEEYGEDFDTSIIDSIDDELSTPKENTDETMIFGSVSTDKALKDEVVDEESEDEKNEEIDSIMEKLNSLDEEDEPLKKEKEGIQDKKNYKRYTKSKKVSSSADDFLAQMEENLKKDKKK